MTTTPEPQMDPRLNSPTPVPDTALTSPTPTTTVSKTPIVSNGRVYDALKFIALILLPAVAAVYAAIDGLIGLPDTAQVLGIIVAVDTVLGGLVGVSSAQYNSNVNKYAGDIQIIESEGKKIYNMVMNDDPELIDQMKTVFFKVVKK